MTFKIIPKTMEDYDKIMKIIEKEYLMYSSNETIGIPVIEAIGTDEQYDLFYDNITAGLIDAKLIIHNQS